MSEEDFNKADINDDVDVNLNDSEEQDADVTGEAHGDFHPKKDDGDDDERKLDQVTFHGG